MGRFVAGDAPELDSRISDALAEIGREVEAMRIPRLAGVVLGGGYGRGEGGARGMSEARVGETPTPTLSNDLDFFAIAEEGASDADAVAIAAALEPVSRKWTEKLGADVDFTARTPWRLRHDQERIMVQELVRGYVDVAGKKGDELFSGIERRPAEAIPWMEAARLLMNRGMGLLFAMVKNKKSWSPELEFEKLELCKNSDFVNRNINKCILGVGDAFLVSRGLYRWRAEERVAALAEQGDDGLYARAVEWKFRPGDEPVCDWEKAREIWLDGHMEVIAAVGDGDYGRTLRNAARWIVRRHTLGELGTFGQNPVVRVLDAVARHVREKCPIAPSLRRDWEIFN